MDMGACVYHISALTIELHGDKSTFCKPKCKGLRVFAFFIILYPLVLLCTLVIIVLLLSGFYWYGLVNQYARPMICCYFWRDVIQRWRPRWRPRWRFKMAAELPGYCWLLAENVEIQASYYMITNCNIYIGTYF